MFTGLFLLTRHLCVQSIEMRFLFKTIHFLFKVRSMQRSGTETIISNHRICIFGEFIALKIEICFFIISLFLSSTLPAKGENKERGKDEKRRWKGK